MTCLSPRVILAAQALLEPVTLNKLSTERFFRSIRCDADGATLVISGILS